jgi:hypothetical protein
LHCKRTTGDAQTLCSVEPVVSELSGASETKPGMCIQHCWMAVLRCSLKSGRALTSRFLTVHGGGDFRIPNCHEIVLEMVCGADFWCNRHCRTSPVVLEVFWGQVWPKIGRKQAKSEYRIANEPLRVYNRDSVATACVWFVRPPASTQSLRITEVFSVCLPMPPDPEVATPIASYGEHMQATRMRSAPIPS